MINNNFEDAQSILLDLVRFFLALVVVLGHSIGFFFGYFDGFFPRVFPYPQSIAVVCFFYLSGYLIVGSQIRQRLKSEDKLGRYLFDRAIRVYVTLTPSLFFVVVVDFIFIRYFETKIDWVVENSSLKIFIKNMLLLPSVPYGTMRPVWSLMYEWWIYLVFGGVFFLKSNKIISLLLIAIGVFYTVKVNAGGDAGHIWVIWVMGGVCAYLNSKIPYVFFKKRRAFFGVASIFIFSISGGFYYLSKDAYNLSAGVLMGIFIFLFINGVSGHLKLFFSLKKAAANLAGLSFTLFLTHYTVLTYTKEIFKFEGMLGLVVGISISFFVAFILAFFTEYKLQVFKKFIANFILGKNFNLK